MKLASTGGRPQPLQSGHPVCWRDGHERADFGRWARNLPPEAKFHQGTGSARRSRRLLEGLGHKNESCSLEAGTAGRYSQMLKAELTIPATSILSP